MRIIESLFLAGMFAIPFSGYGAEKFQEQKLPETPALQKVLKKFSADELFFLERLLPQDFSFESRRENLNANSIRSLPTARHGKASGTIRRKNSSHKKSLQTLITF